MENRYAVPLKDGSTVWLPEEAHRRYMKGKLDLENQQLSPEEERGLERVLELNRRQRKQTAK